MKNTRIIRYTAFAFCFIIIIRCCKNPADTASTKPENTPPVLMVPYINGSDVTYIQPFGVPLDFGGGDGKRICPACHLSDEEYLKVNSLFKILPGTYEGYDNLCPNNSYHTNPRQ